MNVKASSSRQPDLHLKVTQYDRVSSLLLALVFLVGLIVLTLLIIWLTNQVFLAQVAVPVQLTELGDGNNALGGGMDLETPTDEELGLESDLETPMVAKTLSVIADAVSDKVSVLDDPRLSGQSQSGGTGDGRMPGGSGSGVSRRWEVRFLEGHTLKDYAKQLDFFGIELGVLMPGNKVVYAYNLSKSKPDTRSGTADAEKRYYLTWRSGELQQADRQLLARAGVNSEGRVILKFLPPPVEAQLAAMEQERAGADKDDIRRTVFGIRTEGTKYSFYVIEQSYRH